MRGPALRPLVLLGAARSGTKILRDSLATAAAVPAVPYDVGYVWRYGNESATDDCLDPSLVRRRNRRLVRAFLAGYADTQGRVIEKTVGNALRAPFVAEILPEAVFVHLVRDGADVVESALREWRRPVDWRYVVRKSRHVPVRVGVSHARRFLRTSVRRDVGADHARSWGPRYPGIDQDLADEGLLVTVARQWRESVGIARRDVPHVACVTELRYEDLVEAPRETLESVLSAVGWRPDPTELARAVTGITPGRAGSGRARLDSAQRAVLDREMGDVLEDLGYARP